MSETTDVEEDPLVRRAQDAVAASAMQRALLSSTVEAAKSRARDREALAQALHGTVMNTGRASGA